MKGCEKNYPCPNPRKNNHGGIYEYSRRSISYNQNDGAFWFWRLVISVEMVNTSCPFPKKRYNGIKTLQEVYHGGQSDK